MEMSVWEIGIERRWNREWRVGCWSMGKSKDVVWQLSLRRLDQPCWIQILGLFHQQINAQHYSSSAPEPVTMFSSSYRTQNSRAKALSCSGRCATGALRQRYRSHRRGPHRQPRCSPCSYRAPQIHGLPSCSDRSHKSALCYGQSWWW